MAIKTLDEVIFYIENNICAKLNSKQISQSDNYGEVQLTADVLYYLKEYQTTKKHDDSVYERGYRNGYANREYDDEVSRRWEESFRASQMPWNHYTEMGG